MSVVAIFRYLTLAFCLLPLSGLLASTAAGEQLPVRVVAQVGHSDDINTIAFSPDGRLVVSGGSDQMVKIWDVATGGLLRTIAAQKSRVHNVWFTPDGKNVVSRGWLDHTLNTWEPLTGRKLRSFQIRMASIAVSPDGRLTACGTGDGTIELRELATGALVRTLDHEKQFLNEIAAVAFSPDGSRILSGDDKTKTVKLWDVASGRLLRVLAGHSAKIELVAFSPDGRTAVTSSFGSDSNIRIWDVESGALRHSIAKKHASGIAFRKGGKSAFMINTFDANSWNLDTGEPAGNFGSDNISLALSPNGDHLLTGGAGWKPALRLWGAESRKLDKTFGADGAQVNAVAFALEGKVIVSGGTDRALKIWSATSGQLLRSITSREQNWSDARDEVVTAISVSPDGRRILKAGANLRMYEIETGKHVANFTGLKSSVYAAAISPDGRKVAAGDSEGVKIWDAKTADLLQTCKTERSVFSIAFSPDGGTILAGGEEKAIALFDVKTGRRLRSLQGALRDGLGGIMDRVASIAFAPDGRSAVSDGSEGFYVWNVSAGTLARKIKSDGASVVAISPDGRLFAADSGDHSLKLYELASGKFLRQFIGHDSRVTSVAFSSDGNSFCPAQRMERCAYGRSPMPVKRCECCPVVAMAG